METLMMSVLTRDDFVDWKLIGKGAFATVSRAVHKSTKTEVAIKQICIKKMGKEMLDRVKQEIKIHRCLDHPSIVKLYNDFEDTEFKYLVLEYCHKGDLQKYLESKKSPFSEKEACSIFQQVVDGAIYLHSKNIMHRDFKPANLLITRTMNIKLLEFGKRENCWEPFRIKRHLEHDLNYRCVYFEKITDFGLSAISQPNDVHSSLVGTPNFMPPEMLTKNKHGLETDCWSLGCLLFTLLVGRPPFDTGYVPSTVGRVMKCDYKIPDTVSIEAKQLIWALLQKDPKQRINIHDILKHDFMRKYSFDYSRKKINRMQDSIDSGMGTSSTLSSKNSGNSRFHSAYPTYVHSLDTLNSCSLTISDNCIDGRTNVRNYRSPSPPVRLKSSPQDAYSNFGNTICKLKNRISPFPSVNDIHKSQYDEYSKGLQFGFTSSHERDCSEERKWTENLEDNQFIRTRIKERFNEDLETKFHNCFEEREFLAEDKITIQNEEFQNSSKKCENCHSGRFNKDDLDKTQNNCHIRNNPDKDVTENHNFIKLHCCCKNIHVPEKHENCHNNTCSIDKVERFSKICSSSNSCCESQHSIIHNAVCARNSESKKNYLVDCSHHWYCNPTNVQCLHSEFCYCRRDPTKNQHSSFHNCDHLQQINSPSIPTKEGDNYNRSFINDDSNNICSTVSPLNTIRLKPIHQKTKNAKVNILNSGEVCIEFLKKNGQQDKIVISQDGLKITIYKSRGIHTSSLLKEEYLYENLPKQYWKKYIYAARFVKLVRAKTPKITFHSKQAKFMLMENSPDADFEGSFHNGGKITKSNNLITIIDNEGKIYNICSENEIKNLECEKQDMWNHFYQCHQYCKNLEATLQTLENTQGFPCFPVIVGRRQLTHMDSLRISNKENISPKDIFSSPSLNSFRMSELTSNITNYFDEHLHNKKEKADRDVSFQRTFSLISKNKNIKNQNHNSSLQSSREIINSNVIVCKHIPEIGYFSVLENRSAHAKFNDKTQLILTKEGLPLYYIDNSGKSVRYPNKDELPSHVMKKLKLTVSVMKELKEEDRQTVTGIT